jgi:amino acid adenylation domain-containing protein
VDTELKQSAATRDLTAAVLRIWRDVLGADTVDPEATLFQLGGHSLLATRIIARVRAELGAAVRLDDFFEEPTLAGMIELVARFRAGDGLSAGPESETGGLAPAALAPAALTPAVLSDPARSAALSWAQEGLWFLYRLDPSDISYNMPVTLRIRGDLDAGLLDEVLIELVDRHEMLRVAFGERDGRPVQMIGARGPGLEVINLSGRPDPAASARELVVERADRPFDLELGPVLRLTLIRLAADDHVLGLVLHHIAADGWSVELLLREISELYAAYAAGQPSPLPPLELGYLDHVRQAGHRDDAAALAYWTEQLAGAPVLDLPTDRPRPPVRSGRGEQFVFHLSADLLDRLEALARAERSTLFMVLLAGFQTLLARYAGQRDVCVGIPVLGREDPRAEGVIGYFATTVVLRGDLGDDPTFRDFLRATRRTTLRGLMRQNVGLERIVAALRTERDRSRTPLFQAMFTLIRQPDLKPRFGDLDAEIFDQGLSGAKTDIGIDLFQGPDGANAVCAYDAELFDRTTIERMMAGFLVLLDDIAARPDARVSELALLSPAERARIVAEWNGTATRPPSATAGELIAAQAARTPHAVAVSYEGRDLTYAELDARADEIAALLGDFRGLIAVSLRRTPDMIASLLAVWKLGAAYLPLDPEFPRDRTALILADSGASVLLTEQSLAGRFPVGDLLLIEDAEPATRPARPRRAHREELAYVLYTSGSTGRPKGVAVPHRALTAFLHAMTGVLGEQTGRAWLALTSLSFDISGLELFLPLTGGGRVVLAPDAATRDGAALNRIIERDGVTDVQATPSGWRLLLGAGFPAGVVDAVVGGEALPPHLAAQLRRCVRRLVNMYGPTETTIWSSCWPVPPQPQEVLIGGPIAGTRLHILDERLEPSPVGVPGELCIAGEGLARGYLGRPGLTADRFIPDPFGPPGSRLYRTGDRARRRPDGAIEFLGRTDNQVKLRGHRIELGEIEAVLGAHPQVSAAAVVVRDEMLVAYVVGQADDLPGHAAAALPSYMIPTLFIPLDALPLTPNGKLDRRALPAVQPAARGRGDEPRTPAQRRVAQVLAEVLGCGPVGVDDDFFALGGHSLLAAKTVARLGGLPIGELFAHPTVGALAAVLEQHAGEQAAAAPRPPGGAATLSPAQQRLWFLHRLEPESAAYNMYNVWRLRGPLDPDALRAALGDLAARHEILRTRYPDDDGRPALAAEPAAAAVLEQIELPGAEDEAGRLVAERVNAPFDLTAAPPVRVSLIRLAEDDHIVCLVLHHIVGDGWSLNILREELAALYAARRHGTAAALAEPLVQYAGIEPEYWNRDRDAALEYWRGQLAEPTVLDLPTDRPRPQQSAHRGGIHPFRFPDEATRNLEALGRRHGATLFMVLLAAYQVLLSRHTGQADILVGTPAAGRDRVEFESVVGYFTRTLVLRGEVGADLPFDALLGRTRRTVLDALDHQDVPFEDVLAALGVERDPARTPLFQTMAILHSQDEDGAGDTFADLGFEFFDAGYRQAKFDLMLEAWRDGEGLALVLDYDAELFDPSTVATLAERLVVLLGAIVAEPSRPAGDLPILTAADQRFLDARAHAAADRGPLVPELIACAADRTPDAIAVTCADETITYAQLRDRAEALARRLAGHDVVGVCLNRSADMVVALLAAWDAGAAYLPLDPAYPAERREFMIADSGASAVVTEAVITDASAPASPGDARRAVVEHAPAYVIYTSGSTGVPKGVEVTHANLAARVRWMVDAYELGPDDRIVQFASLSFDAHAEEIFPALAAGAQVVLLPDGGASLPDFLAVSPDVTVLDLPTAYWHQLVELIDAIEWPSALRLVILGGEQASGAAVDRWRQRFGRRVRLVNTYGPTETTIIATAADLAGGDARPPIGRPIGATGVQVLDRAGRLVPPGVVGELAIGGGGVAAGYRARPALTAGRFVPDPHGEPGARRYLTGDLVRWRGDGDLEFLRRLDDQVKVRGFRVEPGEVETAILGHPAISAAAVIARDDALVGYVVGGASADELHRYLAEALPAHLVPDVLVHVDRLPLTAAGKVDHVALAAIASEPAYPETSEVDEDESPLTDAEQLVADVWAEVLGLERVRAGHHFFRLGGHSLIALRVIARVRAATQVTVPVRTLFTHPVLRDFAAAVEDLLVAELDALTDEEAQRLLATTEDS